MFRDFDDYWRPFTLGGGPAPGYCASLLRGAGAPEGEVGASLPAADGGIALKARAWAVRGVSG